MPICWGWSPAHGAYVGCRQRVTVEGHCAGCRARCGYELEATSCSTLRNAAGSSYQAIAPMTSELLLGVGGTPPGEFGALWPRDSGHAEVMKDALNSDDGAVLAQPMTPSADAEYGALSQDEIRWVSQLARAVDKAFGLDSDASFSGALDDATQCSASNANGAPHSERTSASSERHWREDTGTRLLATRSASSGLISPDLDTHPWLAAGGAVRRHQEIGDVVARFSCLTQHQQASAATGGACRSCRAVEGEEGGQDSYRGGSSAEAAAAAAAKNRQARQTALQREQRGGGGGAGAGGATTAQSLLASLPASPFLEASAAG